MRYEPKGFGWIFAAILIGVLGGWLGGEYKRVFALVFIFGIAALFVWLIVEAFFVPLMNRMEDNESLIKMQNEAIPEEFWELLLWAAERGEFTKRDLADAFGLGKKVAGEIGELMATLCTPTHYYKHKHHIELKFAFSKEQVLKMKRNWQFHCLTSSSMKENLLEVRDFDEWLAPLTLLEKEESDKFSHLRRLDTKFWDVALWAAKKGQFSLSELQSSFKMGFSRASRLVDQMEHLGICGKAKGNPKSRDILMCPEEVATLRKKWKDEMF